MIAHIHVLDLDPESLDLWIALIGAIGIIIAAYVSTRTRRKMRSIERNIQPSNGDTLAELVESNGLVLRTLVDGQHQIGARIDTLRGDLNDQRIDVQEMDRVNQEAHQAILAEVRRHHSVIQPEVAELVTEVKKRADPTVGPAHVHKRVEDEV